MRQISFQPASLGLGAVLALTAVVSMSLRPTEVDPDDYEYQILIDIEEGDIPALAKKGWEYVGYLGQSKKGTGSDETLWRRIDD